MMLITKRDKYVRPYVEAVDVETEAFLASSPDPNAKDEKSDMPQMDRKMNLSDSDDFWGGGFSEQ